MSGKETPLAVAKRLYQGKDKLIETVVSSFKRLDENGEELEERLKKASNAKLLRLADIAKTITDKYGSKGKLIEAVAAAKAKAKDSDYATKLRSFPLGKLLDMARSAERKQRR